MHARGDARARARTHTCARTHACTAHTLQALPLLLDRLANPVTAILLSVTAVLFFGEIVPQSICARSVVVFASCGIASHEHLCSAPFSCAPVACMYSYNRVCNSTDLP